MIVIEGEKKENQFAEDVRKGLSAENRVLSSKYFYNDEGSQIFEQIMDLEEYYPTRTEREIMNTCKANVLQHLKPEAFHLVDIGAGDGAKTYIFIEHFMREGIPFDYIPIDISPDALFNLQSKLALDFPDLKVTPVVAEYFEALTWIQKNTERQKLVLFLGGNIGNFTKVEAQKFLSSIENRLNIGDLLYMGFDLKKDPRTIRNAYDDKKGVTAEFNFNLLRRLNSEFDGNFNLEQWQHYASYEPVSGAVQSYLLPVCDLRVRLKKLDFEADFDAWQPLHTEYSFKYTLKEIEAMARKSGFAVAEHCFPQNKYFVDSIFKVME